ncbi:MAG: glycosyltransferase family 39 protein [Lachnospiraceae bacterium]|nr:glycosyltransferase family 39 protein [Lachnospiraceae bacterium]
MKNSSFALKPFILLFTLILTVSFCFDTTQETLKNPAYLFAFIAGTVLILTFWKDIKKDEMTVIYIIMISGILLKTAYVLYTAVYTRQHDVIDFGAPEGHAAYIEYIYYNNALPTGDPREKWAFFQPPLHHVIAAVWMKLCNKFTHVYRQLQENVQALTLFYTSAVEILSLFICRELKLKKKGMLAAMLLISFHPVYIIMSGSINNDALSLVFSIAALYIAILWYKNPCLPYIILLALAIGLSMLAKLSGGTVAPAVAFIFLLRFIRDEKDRIKYLIWFVIFGIIVFPLGIGWEIRNMISFGMPFNYIPPVGEILPQTGFVSRILDIRINSIYPSMIAYGDKYDEYNVIVQMIKSSLFGEYDLGLDAPFVTPFAVVLFISAILLVLCGVYVKASLIKGIIRGRSFNIRRESMSDLWVMLFIYYIVMLISYFSFALSSDNFSAMDFRYISAVIVTDGLFFGIYTDGRPEEEGRVKVVFLLLYIFCLSSFLVYILLGFGR